MDGQILKGSKNVRSWGTANFITAVHHCLAQVHITWLFRKCFDFHKIMQRTEVKECGNRYERHQTRGLRMQLIPVSSKGGEERGRSLLMLCARVNARDSEIEPKTPLRLRCSKHILETRRAGWPPPHQPARKRQCVVSCLVAPRRQPWKCRV